LTIAYQSSITFDSVIVIESLRSSDLKTGSDLFETVLLPASFHDRGLLVELHQIASGAEFLKVLLHIEGLVRNRSRRPILQFEMHGSEFGLAFSSGDRLGWADIAPALVRINRASRMNLLLIAALCHGWYMIDILRPTDRAPAYGIIGTPEKIAGGALLQAMQRLYGSILQPPHDLMAALKSANSHLESDGQFRVVNAELMLCRIYSHYIETHATGEALETRVNGLAGALAPSRALDVRETMMLRDEVRAELNNHAKWFDHYRERFLLLDEAPENVQRFRLTYDECASLSPSSQG
jgi:hypothetical protein